MRRLPLKTISGVLFFILCCLLTGCTEIDPGPQHAPTAVAGVLDLRDWDFEQDGSIHLSGEWRFFWKELRQPDQITA